MSAVREDGLAGVVPFRFACHRCGHCCSGGTGFVWLADGEVERMAAQLDMTSAAFTRMYVRHVVDPRTGEMRAALREVENEGGRCALLRGKNACSVYDARPEHCRKFPYWDAVLADAIAFEGARATCPGIAVVVDEIVRERAFAALRALYASLDASADACAEPATCCLAGEDESATFATALEADYALAGVPSSSAGCRLGDRRPLGCRTRAIDERPLRAVRAIERETGYPAAYSRLSLLLAVRTGVEESSR